MLDCQLFPQILDVMSGTADYKTRKEAAWAVLNATSGGTEHQIRREIRMNYSMTARVGGGGGVFNLPFIY